MFVFIFANKFTDLSCLISVPQFLPQDDNEEAVLNMEEVAKVVGVPSGANSRARPRPTQKALPTGSRQEHDPFCEQGPRAYSMQAGSYE